MKQEELEKLEKIFRSILKLKPEQDVQSLRKEDVKKWDSMATVTLFTAIESEFGIRLDVKDAERINSFESVRDLISEKRT